MLWLRWSPRFEGLVRAAPRFLFFTGKGGVGKTSTASAAAIALADRGRRVLLVSTDPASNLDEVLGLALGPAPRQVPGAPGLDALNIDPLAAAAAYRERVVGPYRGPCPPRCSPASRNSCRGRAPSRSPPSTSSPPCWRARCHRGLRPRCVRHRAHRAHPEVAVAAPGMGRVHQYQHCRHLVPRAAVGPGQPAATGTAAHWPPWPTAPRRYWYSCRAPTSWRWARRLGRPVS